MIVARNEFETQCVPSMAMAFLTLFPDGKGNSTNTALLGEATLQDTLLDFLSI